MNTKEISTILLCVVLLLSCSNNEDKSDLTFVKASSVISIDGRDTEDAWNEATWHDIDQVWIGGTCDSDDFSGRYKTLWSEDRIYVVAQIVDDTLIDIHSDGLYRYWDDDCLEVFVDADASGGDHQYNYNAFAYHIGLDGKVADIGVDSLPHYYDHVVSARTHKGNMTIWELAITPYDDTYVRDENSQPIKLSAGQNLGFAIAYCDNDYSQEREHFIGSAVVTGDDKNRGWIDAGIFDKVILAK